VVPANHEHDEGSLMRELVGDREVEMEDTGSELSELEGSAVGMEEEEETGRPNFVRAATEAGRRVEQSIQEFFWRGNGNGHSNDDLFDASGKVDPEGGPRVCSLGGSRQPAAGGNGADAEFRREFGGGGPEWREPRERRKWM